MPRLINTIAYWLRHPIQAYRLHKLMGEIRSADRWSQVELVNHLNDAMRTIARSLPTDEQSARDLAQFREAVKQQKGN